MLCRSFAVFCVLAFAFWGVGAVSAGANAQSAPVYIRLVSDDAAPCNGVISIYANEVWSAGFSVMAGQYLDVVVIASEGQWIQVRYQPSNGIGYVLYPAYPPTQDYYVTIGGGVYRTGFASSASVAGVQVVCGGYAQYQAQSSYDAEYSLYPGGSSVHGRLDLPGLYVIGPDHTTHAQNYGLQAHTLYPIRSSVAGAGDAFAAGALVIPAP